MENLARNYATRNRVMGLLESIFQKKPSNELMNANAYFKTLTAYQPRFTTWSGQLYESELVRSAIDARARHISKLKVKIQGSAKPKLQTVLRQIPNEFQTWSQFLYRLSTILDMQNTAFVVPCIDTFGDVCGYYPVLPSQCEILQTKMGRRVLRYTFADRSTASCWMDECGILTKFQYKDDFFGTSNSALNDTMELIDIQNQGIQEAVKNSATYRFMAQVNNFSKAEDIAKERQRFSNENLKSDSNGGGLLLFPNTYTNIQQIKSSPYTVDAEQRKLIEKNVYNYYGVNEDILQNKAYGDAWSAFYEGAIEPFAIQFSEVFTKMTFSPAEISRGAEVIATSNRLQYLSNQDKLNVSSQMADRGLMTINEIRDIWNLPPVEDGDVRTIRGEYYQLDDKESEETQDE